MTDEDIIAAKLKGYNCLIKFKDGEELLLFVEKLSNTEEDEVEWLMEVERFINPSHLHPFDYFPADGIAITRESIKYVRKL